MDRAAGASSVWLTRHRASLEEDQDVLRVVVTDGGEDFAFDPGSVDPDSDEPFGLLLVDELADRWGVSLDGKKAIWLEVDTRPRPIGRYRTARMYGGAVGEPESTTCPICGKGTLRTVDFGDQQPDSREVQTFTCGHEVKGGRLRTADADGLDVERRQSEETVTPIDSEE